MAPSTWAHQHGVGVSSTKKIWDAIGGDPFEHGGEALSLCHPIRAAHAAS
jgi:hypothetical protein